MNYDYSSELVRIIAGMILEILDGHETSAYAWEETSKLVMKRSAELITILKGRKLIITDTAEPIDK